MSRRYSYSPVAGMSGLAATRGTKNYILAQSRRLAGLGFTETDWENSQIDPVVTYDGGGVQVDGSPVIPAGTTGTSFWPSALDTTNFLQSLGEKYLSFRQMREINDANLERMRRGLQPLNASAYAPQVNVGVAPDTQKMILYAGVGILAAFALNSFLKKR